jgi:hypothetical protein
MPGHVFRFFKNDGFGWQCLKCAAAVDVDNEAHPAASRLMREGEAESKTPVFSSRAIARWVDRSKGVLECPICGGRERGISEDEDS